MNAINLSFEIRVSVLIAVLVLIITRIALGDTLPGLAGLIGFFVYYFLKGKLK